jgi:hypothetical protein
MTQRLSRLRPEDLDAWRAWVRTYAAGGHAMAVGLIIAQLAEPETAMLRLHEANRRRLILGANVHPVGLRRILTLFVAIGLLVPVEPAADPGWRDLALALPGGPVARPVVSRQTVLTGWDGYPPAHSGANARAIRCRVVRYGRRGVPGSLRGVRRTRFRGG